MNSIAREYATALFSLANDCNCEKKYLNDLKTVKEQFDQNPLYLQILSSPDINKEKRRELAENAFRDYVSPDVLNFLKLLCDNGRLVLLTDCFSEYEDLFREFNKAEKARVISAIPLTDPEKQKVETRLKEISKKEITVSYEIDKSIIGGLVIYMGNTVIDGSLKSELNKIKEAVSK